MRRSAVVSITVIGAVLALSACSAQTQPPVSSTVLLDKVGTTILGEGFQYPVTSDPEITSSVVRLEPGAETGWHLHEAPMYAYILEGTLEVTYEVDGSMVTKVYNEGEAIMEGLDTRHNGKNTADGPVSVLVVNMGSPELENTVKQ
jgi:quercetin dioxygenase-like cupin family protein